MMRDSFMFAGFKRCFCTQHRKVPGSDRKYVLNPDLGDTIFEKGEVGLYLCGKEAYVHINRANRVDGERVLWYSGIY